MTETIIALWWVPAGHIPTIEEGIARLEHLRANGPSPHAFTFREPFPAPASATWPGELMFTGIVEELGPLRGPRRRPLPLRRPSTVLDGARLGDSIAVNGTCLTARRAGRRVVGGRRERRDGGPHQPRRPGPRRPGELRTPGAHGGPPRRPRRPRPRRRRRRVVAPAPDLRVQIPRDPDALLRGEGVDRRRRHQPHDLRPRRRDVPRRRHPPHRRRHHARLEGRRRRRSTSRST